MRTFVSVFGLRPLRIGGIESLIRECANGLHERGWRSVVVFAGEPGRNVWRYLDVPGLTIKVLLDFDDHAWSALPSLYSLLRKHNAECVHFHFTDLLNPAFLLTRLIGARCFVTVHRSLPENHQACLAPLWKRAAARPFLSPVERVFCVSNFVRGWMESTGYFRPEQLTTLHNGICMPDLQSLPVLRAKYRSLHGIPEDAPMVLQVGQLIREKGVEDVLQAVPELLERFPDVRLVFIGDGADEETFRKQAATLHIDHAVSWAGVDVDPCGHGAFAAADVLCAPARWQEAFGLTIAEAMSHEVPVVATRMGAIEEIVVHGETGFLVERRSPRDLARRIGQLLSSVELRRRMGRAGYARANVSFNVRKTVRQMLDICGVPEAVSGKLEVRSAARSTAGT